jgi:hypothetical protein
MTSGFVRRVEETDWLSAGRGKLRPSDYAIAVGIAVVWAGVLLATSDMGFTRDEGFYFHAARQYLGWFLELESNWKAGAMWESFTRENIDRHWSYNPEHPVLMKAAFGLSYELLHHRLGWLSPYNGMRFPAMALAGSMMGGLYLFAFEVTGRRWAAGLAVALLACMPHVFFHSHLTCFDVPIMAVIFWTTWAFWKSLDSRGWAIATGVLWGIGLGVKLNAFFLPVIWLAWWALARPWEFSFRRGMLRVPAVPRALFAMALLGPVLFYALWPRHWFDTFQRVRWYFNFHLRHEHYFVEFFGQNYWEPPFPVSFPFVMTAVTTPIVTLLLLVGGALVATGVWVGHQDAARRVLRVDRYGTGLFLFLNALFPFAVIAMPESPIFGGIKHWFPALPFWIIGAMVGVVWWVDQAGRTSRERGIAATVIVLSVLVPGVRTTVQNHPHGIAYHNELVGGHTGAADRRNMRQFWGYETRKALPWINEHVEHGASIFLHNTVRTSGDMYHEAGLLREDLRSAPAIERADWVVYDQQKAFAEVQSTVWHAMGTFAPEYVTEVAGVPMVSVYRRRADARPSVVTLGAPSTEGTSPRTSSATETPTVPRRTRRRPPPLEPPSDGAE